MRTGLGRAMLLAALTVLLALPAVAVVRAPSVAPAAVTPALVTDIVPLPAGAPSRPLPAGTPVTVTLTLAYDHPAALAALLVAVQQPGSPQYRHFLTASEFRAAFDPTPATLTAATSTLIAYGARSVGVGPSGATVSGTLPAIGVDRLFGVDLRSFASVGAVPVFTATGSPTLPPALAGRVVGVGGLSNAANFRLTLAAQETPVEPVRAPANGSAAYVLGTQGVQWLLGSDYTQVYNAT
ncbi:secreted protein containing Peptidase S53, propeptide domain protein, partial [mine drainage metagenome]